MQTTTPPVKMKSEKFQKQSFEIHQKTNSMLSLAASSINTTTFVDHFFFRNFMKPSWDSISTWQGLHQFEWLLCTQMAQFPVSNKGKNHPIGKSGELTWQNFKHFLYFRMRADFMRRSIAKSHEALDLWERNVFCVKLKPNHVVWHVIGVSFV